jgi:predicted acetyltransferase
VNRTDFTNVTTPIRRATEADLPAMFTADGRAFGEEYSAEDIDDLRTLIDPDRFLVACDPADGSIVGITGDFPFDVTLPGGTVLPVPGVSWVSVAVTHRRRGVLRALLTEQHRGFVEAGAAVSLLTASEGGIYGRFGYGVATRHRWVEIARRQAVLRAGVPDPGGVRLVGPDELRKAAPEIHRRWAATTPGAVSRSDAWWDELIRDRERHRHGASVLFHMLHPDGYASYRIRRGEQTACEVREIVAATEEAHAALWRVLLALDLVDTVRAVRPVDDPLPEQLTDARRVHTTGLRDGMWARILDLPAALAARRYSVELDVVLEVRDPFLDRGGRFRLRGGPDGAQCDRVDAAGDAIGIGMAMLGSLLFGGRRAGTLAAAGLVQAPDQATLRRFDLAMLADREPQHGTEF